MFLARPTKILRRAVFNQKGSLTPLLRRYAPGGGAENLRFSFWGDSPRPQLQSSLFEKSDTKNFLRIAVRSFIFYFVLIHLSISPNEPFFPYINIPVRYILAANHTTPTNDPYNNTNDNTNSHQGTP